MSPQYVFFLRDVRRVWPHHEQIQNAYSPPRRRPQNLTTPAPLSPSNGLTPPSLPRNSSGSSNIGIGVQPPVCFLL